MKHAIVRRAAHRRRATQAGALTAALLLTLTACGGGTSTSSSTSPAAAPPSASTTTASTSSSPAPATSPTATSAASPSGGSSSASASGEYVPASADGPAQNVPTPVMPEAMKRKDQAGAEAAVRYWWDAIYYLQQTNDPEPMLAASNQSTCDFCTQYAANVAEIYSDGSWYTGTKPTVNSVIAAPVGDAIDATALVSLGDGLGFSSNGLPIEKTRAEAEERQPWRYAMSFDKDNGHWVVDVAEMADSSS